MKTKSTIALFLIFLACSAFAQTPEAPKVLRITNSGYARWLHPDKLFVDSINFNDGQLPDGWTLESYGTVQDPFHIESPSTNPNLPGFPSDNSCYMIANSDNLTGENTLHEYITSPLTDISNLTWAFVQFNHDFVRTYGTYCTMEYRAGNYGWEVLYRPVNSASGVILKDIVPPDFTYRSRIRFSFTTKSSDTHFAVDDIVFIGELAENVTNNVMGFRLWLDDQLIGDVADSDYQIDTDTLTYGSVHTFKVATIYEDTISEAISETFEYISCDETLYNVDNFAGRFSDSTTIELSWEMYYWDKDKPESSPLERDYNFNSLITHPHAGYNNGWGISALHDGLTDYGYDVNHKSGLMVADDFEVNYDWGGITGFDFFLYQCPTPSSTITGAYVTLYDGDPSNGGQIVWNKDVYMQSGMAEAYRTAENDFSDIQRPIMRVHVSFDDLNFPQLPLGTYWFTASFEGSMPGGVYAVPRTILGEIETGNALIYSPESGWQPMLDSGTQTQQGLAFRTIGLGGSVPYATDYSNLYRDGVLIGSELKDYNYTDYNVSHEPHTYSIENVYLENGEKLYSCRQYIDVRPCYPPKNIDGEIEYQNDSLYFAHIYWEAADDIPQREDITTTYNVYRKIGNEYKIIAVVPDDGVSTSFSFTDTLTSNGFYCYKVNAYNVYQVGSCLSNFARYADNNQYDYVCLNTNELDFAPLGARWFYEILPAGGNGTAYYEMMESSSDTTINGKEKVKIIIKVPAMYKGETGREYVYYENGFVYWYNPRTNDFTKLYNFSAEKGESWSVNYGDYQNYVYVNDVNYEEIQGVTYKTMEVRDNYDDFTGKIICGVGNTKYLFPFSTFVNRAEGDYPNELRCYFENDYSLILSIGEHDCDAIYLVSIDETNDNQFVIYPNPANSTINIEGAEIQKIEIYNVLGEKIYSEEVNDADNKIIGVSSFSKGIYLITITMRNGKVESRKVVVE